MKLLSIIKNLVRSLVPNSLLKTYHKILGSLAAFYFGYPSKDLVIIGVTGTNGKSTTVNLISKIFEEAGFKTALSSTVNFKVGDDDQLNDRKMTMPGRFFLQRLLWNAKKSGCKFAIIESSSEGVLQNRHLNIAYDAMVFTNLTPEHIEAHGGFENYKNAKLEYFRHLKNLPDKIIAGKKIKKSIIVNSDDKYGNEFLNFNVDQKITYGKTGTIKGSNLSITEQGISFDVNGTNFNLKLKGQFDFYNTLAAIATASAFDVSLATAKKALEEISVVPGRMELIDEGQLFKVVVDYSPEPESLKQVYETIKHWNFGQLIHILGSTGGGRDIARRKILGEIAAKNSNVVIVTNEDPYNDDPMQIIEDVAEGALENGKIKDQDLYCILDRRQAIAKALQLAKENDLVLITGKGSEQKMAVKDGYIPWDDRKVAREELKKL